MNVAALEYDEICERVTVLPYGDRYHVEVDADGVEGGVVTMFVAGNTVAPRRNTFDESTCAREPKLFLDGLCADARAIVKRFEDEYQGPSDAQIAAQYHGEGASEVAERQATVQRELKR